MPTKTAPEIRNRIKEYRVVDPAELAQNSLNWRDHPEEQHAALVGILGEIGIAGALVAYHSERNGGALTLIDGHDRSTVDTPWPCLILDVNDAEADTLLASIHGIERLAKPNAGKLDSLLRNVSSASPAVQSMLGKLAEGSGLLAELQKQKGPKRGPTPHQPTGPQRAERGDLWQIGRHFLIVGDCTERGTVQRLAQGNRFDILLADPPYCSGGFQEAGKRSGSIGTRGDEMIANDTLSTRGYMALMKAMLRASGCGLVYLFTDWRMWINLFDCVESSGFGVRNMVVWDKGTPGMGVGWRAQHEIVMCAMKVSHPFNPKKAQGNVIQAKRTGNKLHPTEKPVDLLVKILEVNDLARTVFDPFGGSGPTLIAAEQTDRTAFLCELDPHHADSTLARGEAEGLTVQLIERLDPAAIDLANIRAAQVAERNRLELIKEIEDRIAALQRSEAEARAELAGMLAELQADQAEPRTWAQLGTVGTPAEYAQLAEVQIVADQAAELAED